MSFLYNFQMKQFKHFSIAQIGFKKITLYVAESDNNSKSFLPYFSLSITTILLPLSAFKITMSSYCFNSSIARFSAFDRFGLGGLALQRPVGKVNLAST